MSWILRNVSRQHLDEIVKQSRSIRQVLQALGMCGGGSHNAIKIKIAEFGLDISHFTGKGWMKGKGLEDPSVANIAKKVSNTTRGRPTHRIFSIETRQKLSEKASERSFANGCVKTTWRNVVNPLTGDVIRLQGSWEQKYAEWCNKNFIKWERPKNFFYWSRDDNDIKHRYHPDFFLPDFSEYVEIKGFMWKDPIRGIDDELKLRKVVEQNPEILLTILMERELKLLGILS